MPRGRKKDFDIPQTRALTTQRAYRARKAAHLANLEERVRVSEEENAHLREQLAMAQADPSYVGYNHSRQTADAAAELLQSLSLVTTSLSRFQQLAFPADVLAAAQQQGSIACPSTMSPPLAPSLPWVQNSPASRPTRGLSVTSGADASARHPHDRPRSYASGPYATQTPPLGHAWAPLPPPSAVRATQQQGRLPSLTGGMNVEGSPKPRDVSVANLLNVPPGRPLVGPTPSSLDPITGPSRLVPMSSPHALPYPLMASSSAGASSLNRYGSDLYADVDDYSDSEGESIESDEGSQEMNDVGPQENGEPHRLSGEESLVPSSSTSPSHKQGG